MPSYQQNKKSAEKYLSQFDHITLRLLKGSGLKDQIQEQAKLRGEPVNTYIIRAIEARMYNHSCKLDGEDHSGVDHWNDTEKK